jgi:hypothetical protein
MSFNYPITLDMLQKLHTGFLPLSRSTLQNVKSDNDGTLRKFDIYQHISQIHNNVIKDAKYKSSYIYKINQNGYQHFDNPVYASEFKEMLQKVFPDCKTDYVETRGYDGKVIERVAVVVWS